MLSSKDILLAILLIIILSVLIVFFICWVGHRLISKFTVAQDDSNNTILYISKISFKEFNEIVQKALMSDTLRLDHNSHSLDDDIKISINNDIFLRLDLIRIISYQKKSLFVFSFIGYLKYLILFTHIIPVKPKPRLKPIKYKDLNKEK